MTEEELNSTPAHADRVKRKDRNRSLKVLPSGSNEEWPANLGELLEWHTNEVEEVMRAAQLRLRDSAQVIEDYRKGKIGFADAQERVVKHDIKWGDRFPGGIDGTTRGRSDEEINTAIETSKASKGRG